MKTLRFYAKHTVIYLTAERNQLATRRQVNDYILQFLNIFFFGYFPTHLLIEYYPRTNLACSA